MLRPNKVTVQCDASKDGLGLGAALLRNGQPVAYASRALTDCETHYAQIEECLDILFACEQFDFYLYSREEIMVETDYMPLESIFKKSLEVAPAHLQKMRLWLQRYSLKVTYKRGTQMYIANTLSRAVAMTATVTAQSNSKCKGMVIKQGWPTHRSTTDVIVRPYFSFRDELTTHDGLIFKGQRLVVPLALRKEMLQIAHGGHVGTESTLRHLREALFWPGMNSEASVMVEQCEACQSN